MNTLTRILRHPLFPPLLLLAIALLAGLLVYADYGLSWDEPLFYQYSTAIRTAYSIQARLDGSFDMEAAYGPSADHAYYGPAYLLLAESAVNVLDIVLPGTRADVWHLVNYLTFVAGALLLYGLCRRWVSPWAAFGAGMLFLTQPVLWGHGFINPKDVPFMVFFLAAIYTGYRMVDGFTVGAGSPQLSPSEAAMRWQKTRRFWQVAGAVLVGLALILVLFSAQWQTLISGVVEKAYQAEAGSFLGSLFARMAPNAGEIPVEAYIQKTLIWYHRVQSGMIFLAVLAAIPALALTPWQKGVLRMFRWLESRLGTLPTWPSWWNRNLPTKQWLLPTLLAGLSLGLLVSIRILGPLAGLLVGLYFLLLAGRRPLAGLFVYALTSGVVCLATWPYLWESPLVRFYEVVRHMSNNPQSLPVLFNGVVITSDKLPASYLPVMLGTTLSEPVWLLFLAGIGIAVWRAFHRRLEWASLLPVLLWFLIPFGYVVLSRPPTYDGFRHFMFILPPAFVFIALALQAIFERLRRPWASGLLLVGVLLPGIIALVSLHPYQYTYYNSLIGGPGGAFRRYETDYWLTCYRELMDEVNQSAATGTTLFVHRQPANAREYAGPGLIVRPFDPDDDQTFSGSLLLLTTRSNVDLKHYPDAPELFSVEHDGAVFCLVRQIP